MIIDNNTENELFKALFESASVGIIVTNVTGDIILANEFSSKMFGYSAPDEIINSKVEKLIPPRFHGGHVHHRTDYSNHPQKRPMGLGMDLFAIRKDGTEFPVEISLSNCKTASGNYAFAFINDISKRKQIEKAVIDQKKELALNNLKIEELNNELEQKVELRTRQLQETMQQLEASRDEINHALNKEKELSDLKSRFVSMASHEFRTPLSTILSSASLLAKYTDTEEQEKRNKHIQRIKSSVNNLTDILNEFLSLGRIEDGKIVAHYIEFNLKEMVNSLCNELQGIIKTNQSIDFTYTGKENVFLDPTLLKNVIINLLSNAIKFSPENGKIYIKIEVSDKEILLNIKDSGIGISEEDQEHLFERFFRGANVTNIQGTGLGLHIVGKYIELMDGQIDFKSELEVGTEFLIKFNLTSTDQNN